MVKHLLAGGILILIFVLASCKGKNEQQVEKPDRDAQVKDTSRTAGKKTILFFGNSITAGYGVEPGEAFPALIQETIDSLNLPYTVINAGVSGETSSGGNSRIDWILRQHIDVFVLELGGNDGLRGLPVEETIKNLQSIVDKVLAKNPDTKLILAGMQIPPSMGQEYIRQFRDIYPSLAKKNKMEFIPFLLEGVGGESELNQTDGIHPNPEGHRLVARNVWQVLEKNL